jgi:hypothetical protein
MAELPLILSFGSVVIFLLKSRPEESILLEIRFFYQEENKMSTKIEP